MTSSFQPVMNRFEDDVLTLASGYYIKDRDVICGEHKSAEISSRVQDGLSLFTKLTIIDYN